jgi:hypothetical protein
VGIDTACSTSLVATHAAHKGELPLALCDVCQSSMLCMTRCALACHGLIEGVVTGAGLAPCAFCACCLLVARIFSTTCWLYPSPALLLLLQLLLLLLVLLLLVLLVLLLLLLLLVLLLLVLLLLDQYTAQGNTPLHIEPHPPSTPRRPAVWRECGRSVGRHQRDGVARGHGRHMPAAGEF